MNIQLWKIAAIIPGLSGVTPSPKDHMVWATGRTEAVLTFLRANPEAEDIQNPVPAEKPRVSPGPYSKGGYSRA